MGNLLRPPEGGDFTIVCHCGCGRIFRTNEPRRKYFSEQCKRRAQNKRHYRRHKEKIVLMVLENRARKQKPFKARRKALVKKGRLFIEE